MNYKARRQRLIKDIPTGSVILLNGQTNKVRNNDVEYDFRQDSSYYYLSGNNEPDTKMLIIKDKKNTKQVFFKKQQTELEKVWEDHKRSFVEEKECGGWDEVVELDSYEDYITQALKNAHRAYIDLNDKEIIEAIISSQDSKITSYENILQIVEKYRAIKSKEEISKMRKAVTITADAVQKIMTNITKKKKESVLNAEVEYVFALNEVQKAYQTIVAGGNNGNILHYTKNDEVLNKDKMILVDVGCEYELYASDITRTFPANGTFSKDQKEVYSKLLEIQKIIISKVKPGITFEKLNQLYVEEMAQLLIDLKILKEDRAEIIDSKSYKKYCPHSIGHWLGLDVHDRNPYKEDNKPVKFEAGMVITIEPGIYIGKDDKDVPQKYREIAIRIEDDILVTKEGNENLSKQIPKEIKEIETITLRVE